MDNQLALHLSTSTPLNSTNPPEMRQVQWASFPCVTFSFFFYVFLLLLVSSSSGFQAKTRVLSLLCSLWLPSLFSSSRSIAPRFSNPFILLCRNLFHLWKPLKFDLFSIRELQSNRLIFKNLGFLRLFAGNNISLPQLQVDTSRLCFFSMEESNFSILPLVLRFPTISAGPW